MATWIDVTPLHFLLCWTGYKMKIVIIENEPRIYTSFPSKEPVIYVSHFFPEVFTSSQS